MRVNGGWAITANLGPHNMEKDVALCDVKEENANLIAAAPDLLEALEFLLKINLHGPGIAQAKAAIAKARGEA